MKYLDSIKILTSQEKFHINLGLERMQNIANIFSNPQNDLKIIHVAGTNGKGSTCAMLAQICQDNGLKTGLYTSPHIKSYTERIKINFENISENDFSKYLQLVENTAIKNNILLTEFETLTMMAFLYFKEMKTDIAIFETGLGGRLDATNIIQNPFLTIITSISKDHTAQLGNTTEQIAAEKAGIIKGNIPVIINSNNAGLDIISNVAITKKAPLLINNKIFNLTDIKNNIFSNGEKSFQLSLKGINQGENLSLVIAAAKELNLEPQNALKNVVWNSRFEYIKDKNFIIDGAHNPDGLKLLKQNLDTYYKNQKRAFLFGMLNTKDYKSAIKEIFNENDEIFITDNFAPNAISKEILEKEIFKHFPNIKLTLLNIDEIQKFIEYDFSGIKICCGSFYLTSKFY